MGKKVLGILGTYRKGHITDKIVDEILKQAEEKGASTEKIYLLDKKIEFCLNCRSCTQKPGKTRGKCVHKDDFEGIVNKVESSDSIVLASPVNFSNATAITKRFMERLIVYAYMPWGSHYPRNRIKKLNKKAVLVSASTAPAFFIYLFSDIFRQLKESAKLMGAKKIGRLTMGLSCIKKENHELPEKVVKKAKKLGSKLAI